MTVIFLFVSGDIFALMDGNGIGRRYPQFILIPVGHAGEGRGRMLDPGGQQTPAETPLGGSPDHFLVSGISEVTQPKFVGKQAEQLIGITTTSYSIP